MPINATPQYYKAYREYLEAKTLEARIEKLEEVIVLAPKHKGSENLLAQLKLKLSKLKKESEKKSKKRGASRGIKKTGHAQIIIIGAENTGKSLLLTRLTNAHPVVSELPFTTTQPEIGTLDLNGLKIQMIEIPANADNECFSIVYCANLVLILVISLEQIVKWARIFKEKGVKTKKIVVLNKMDIVGSDELKKISALKNIIKISALNCGGIDELKQKIFDSLDLIRVYTKEIGKKPTEEPVILKKDDSIRNLALKIRKDYVERFIKAKVWGASAKFDGQIVGIEHRLMDSDVVEIYTK